MKLRKTQVGLLLFTEAEDGLQLGEERIQKRGQRCVLDEGH